MPQQPAINNKLLSMWLRSYRSRQSSSPFHEAAAVDHHDEAAREAEDEFDVVLDEKDRKVLRQAGNSGEKARRFRGAARRPRAHRAAAPSAWSHINSKRSDAISTPVREAEIVAENPAGNTGEPGSLKLPQLVLQDYLASFRLLWHQKLIRATMLMGRFMSPMRMVFSRCDD